MLHDLRFRLRALFQKSVVELELNEELRFHFEHEVEKYKRAGMSEKEAVRRARLAFGGQEQVKEACRNVRGISFLETTAQDIRYSVHAMRKNPGFFIIAALTLALGIGASTSVFSLVNTILLKPLPYPNADRVMMLWREEPLAGIGDMPWAPGEYSLLARTETAFQNLGAFKRHPSTSLAQAVRSFLKGFGHPPDSSLPWAYPRRWDVPSARRRIGQAMSMWRS
jgi:hypothetical protein